MGLRHEALRHASHVIRGALRLSHNTHTCRYSRVQNKSRALRAMANGKIVAAVTKPLRDQSKHDAHSTPAQTTPEHTIVSMRSFSRASAHV